MSFKRLQRALFRTMAAVVALAILFCIGLYGYRTMFGYTYDSSLSDEDLAASVTADENITNIALFGLDTREGDKQSHSDCMMIVTVDNTRGKIKLISLMRDSLVDIDGYGEDKLNAAYFRGGPSLAIRTINENFGTDIKDYVAVDFEQLVQIVDAIGGVDIDVQNDNELKELNRVIKDYGADMLRLWVSSADYTQDMRISKDILKQLSQAYLKIRNTARYMLGNLNGFDPDHLVADAELLELDRWAVTKLNELIEKVEQSYNDYEFHIITHAVNDFCVTTLSSFYLDIVKDRLYCEAADSAERRSAQTALYLTLSTLAMLFAPILAFTCDEVWLAMPHTAEDDARNVVLNDMNKPFTAYALDAETMARWEHIIEVRTAVNGALEEARAAKVIGKSLEADVHLTVPEGDVFLADENPAALADLFIVSKVELAVGGELAVKVENAAGTKCPRCWKHSLTPNAEGLCPRCAEVVRHLPDLL